MLFVKWNREGNMALSARVTLLILMLCSLNVSADRTRSGIDDLSFMAGDWQAVRYFKDLRNNRVRADEKSVTFDITDDGKFRSPAMDLVLCRVGPTIPKFTIILNIQVVKEFQIDFLCFIPPQALIPRICVASELISFLRIVINLQNSLCEILVVTRLEKHETWIVKIIFNCF